MNLKGLALRLKRLPKEEYRVYIYPDLGFVHVAQISEETWFQFKEKGSLHTVEMFHSTEDFRLQQRPTTIYRADMWHWPALVAALGLPVSAEAPKLVG